MRLEFNYGTNRFSECGDCINYKGRSYQLDWNDRNAEPSERPIIFQHMCAGDECNQCREIAFFGANMAGYYLRKLGQDIVTIDVEHDDYFTFDVGIDRCTIGINTSIIRPPTKNDIVFNFGNYTVTKICATSTYRYWRFEFNSVAYVLK